jgi:hypothetical protein
MDYTINIGYIFNDLYPTCEYSEEQLNYQYNYIDIHEYDFNINTSNEEIGDKQCIGNKQCIDKKQEIDKKKRICRNPRIPYTWSIKILEMSTKQLNKYIQDNNISCEDKYTLKKERRRLFNCTYARNSRIKNKALQY